MRYLCVVCCAFLLLHPDATAQTIVSGNVTGVWNPTGNPYIVSGNINVIDSLVIKPGVIVQFDGGGWSIRTGAGSKLRARGTADNVIRFEALTAQNPGAWDAIILENSGADDTLENCVIRSAYDGIRVLSGGGFTNATIKNTNISNSAASGVLLETGVGNERSIATISQCLIHDNLGDGVLVYAHGAGQDSVTIIGCTIDGNQLNGINVQVVWYWNWDNPIARAMVWNSTIIRNTGIGVKAYHVTTTGSASALVRNSAVVYNHGYGVANVNGGNIIPSDVSYNCFWRNGTGDFQNITATGFGHSGSYGNANGDSCDVNFNVYTDPLLADTLNHDYRLHYLSRAIDAGTPSVSGRYVLDPDGTLPDIGAFYFSHEPGVRLISPAPNELLRVDTVRFIWSQPVPSVRVYCFEVGTDSVFNNSTIDSTSADTTRLEHLSDGIRWWRVRAKGNLCWQPYRSQRRFQVLTSEVPSNEDVPSVFGLFQNYPNPFNPSTKIRYALPQRSRVSLSVFNTLGQRVAQVVNGYEEAGYHEVKFDASGFVSGVYFYRIQAGGFVQTKKLLLLR